MSGSRPRPDLGVALDEAEFAVFDLETTGMNSRRDAVVSIGAVRIRPGGLEETFTMLVDPGRAIPESSSHIHGIRDADVRGAPALAEALPAFRTFVGAAMPVSHLASFDLGFLRGALRRLRLPPLEPALDTALLAERLFPDLRESTLETIALRFGLSLEGRHSALGDARIAAKFLLVVIPVLQARGARTLADALHWGDAHHPIHRP